MRWRGKVVALLELVGVFVTGAMAARWIGRIVGLEARGLRGQQPGVTPDFFRLAVETGANLLLRYGLILGMAFLIGWWHRRRSLAAYGVTSGGLSFRAISVIGIVLFAVGGLLPKILLAAKDYLSLGREPAHWQLISSSHPPGFWLYMAVSSFGLVPIVEELFFRGYMQTRLVEPFGAPAAIVMTAAAFTLAHRQYFIGSVIGIGMLLSILASSLLAGYVRFRFGSLLPGIVAHALGNVPLRNVVAIVVPLLMVVVIILARRRLLPHLRRLGRLFATPGVVSSVAVAVAVVAVILSLAILRPALLPATGLLSLGVALAFEFHDRPEARVPDTAG